jgi:hypothetical protein
MNQLAEISTDNNFSNLNNEKSESVFSQMTNGIDVDEFIENFTKEKSNMVHNYKALKRCKRNMNNDAKSILFTDHEKDYMPSTVKLKVANKRLESKYWKEILDGKDLFTIMSYQEKKKWDTVFEEMDIPTFNQENVILSIREILNSSSRYFAERICFALESLSKDHVTNSQFGFGEKVIIKDVHSGMNASNPYPSLYESKYSALEEIRKIVAFLSTGNLNSLKDRMSTYDVLSACIDALKKEGKSEFTIDNGNIFIKVFKIGTMHMYINPEIAEKMNNFVSVLYPNKLPSTLKRKSNFKGSMKKQTLQTDPVSRLVIDALRDLNYYNQRDYRAIKIDGENIHYLSSDMETRLKLAGLYGEFHMVLAKIGGAVIDQGHGRYYSFPYSDVKSVTSEIMITGGTDNQVAYQQYYTKDYLAKDAYDLMTDLYSNQELIEFDFLEPSCGGLGGLMDTMPKAKVKGVDISRINVSMRKAQGFNVEHSDFVDYAKTTNDRFNMILSNPPFKKSQAYNHTMLSFGLLKETGVLVAILPLEMRDKFDHLMDEDTEITKSEAYENSFDDTNWSVFILRITKR